MRNRLCLLLGLLFFISLCAHAQSWKSLGKQIKEKAKKAEKVVLSEPGLSEEEVGRGLKEALNQGVQKGVTALNKKDGYFKDPEIKILMPQEAKTVEQKLRDIGQGKKVDEAIESMNRAAEDAASGAKDIFMVAIKQMTLDDVMGILKGEDDAATNYLDRTTREELTRKFEPVIKVSLDKVGATKHWNSVFTVYNKIPFVKEVNANLEEYVTDKALKGLFIQIAKEELLIRKDPLARTTDLLKKVFSEP